LRGPLRYDYTAGALHPFVLIIILAGGMAAPAATSSVADVWQWIATGAFEQAAAAAAAAKDLPAGCSDDVRRLAALKSRIIARGQAKPLGVVTLFLRSGVIVQGTVVSATTAELTLNKLGGLKAHVPWQDLNPPSLHAVLATAADPQSADDQIALGIHARAARLGQQTQVYFTAAFDLDPTLAQRIVYWSGQPLNARQQTVLREAAELASYFKGRARPLFGGRVQVSYDFSNPKQLDDWRGIGGSIRDWKIADGALAADSMPSDPLVWRALTTGTVEVSAKVTLPKEGYVSLGLVQWADSTPPSGLLAWIAALKGDKKFALRHGDQWSKELDLAPLSAPFVMSAQSDGRRLRSQVNGGEWLELAINRPSSAMPQQLCLHGFPDSNTSFDDVRITATLDAAWLATERWLRANPSWPRAVRVESGKPWQDSRLDLQGGRRYRVLARGGWSSSPLFGQATADGSASLNDALGARLRSQSLVGRIGKDGKPFQLGCDRLFIAPASGRLFLQVNATYLGDNKGSMEALFLNADHSAVAR
jgi:hypothetical protein